jgi:hypothetical protein
LHRFQRRARLLLAGLRHRHVVQILSQRFQRCADNVLGIVVSAAVDDVLDKALVIGGFALPLVPMRPLPEASFPVKS